MRSPPAAGVDAAPSDRALEVRDEKTAGIGWVQTGAGIASTAQPAPPAEGGVMPARLTGVPGVALASAGAAVSPKMVNLAACETEKPFAAAAS